MSSKLVIINLKESNLFKCSAFILSYLEGLLMFISMHFILFIYKLKAYTSHLFVKKNSASILGIYLYLIIFDTKTCIFVLHCSKIHSIFSKPQTLHVHEYIKVKRYLTERIQDILYFKCKSRVNKRRNKKCSTKTIKKSFHKSLKPVFSVFMNSL